MALVAFLLSACGPSGDTMNPVAYSSPLVRLQQLVGENNHIHIDEVRYREDDRRLFQCGYDFGVIDAADPENMVYLAERIRHSIPGDRRSPGCIHLAADLDTVYTTHRGNIDNPAFLSGWELRPDPEDPSRLAPVQLPVLQEPGVSYEGVDVANGYVYVALRQNGLGVYERGAEGGFRRVGTSTGLSNAWGVRVRGNTAFVSDGLDGLALIDITDPANPRVRSRVATGGQARGLALGDGVVYVAAGSRGLVLVDVSDLDDPEVLSYAGEVPGTAVRVDYADGYAYVAAWSDARVYDVSDAASPRFVGAVRMTREIAYEEEGRPPVTSRTLGIAAAGDTMLIGNWHVVHSYRVFPDRVAPNIVLPEAINLLDFGAVTDLEPRTIPVRVKNQGTAPLTITGVSVDNPLFSVEPERVRIPAGETENIEVRYAGDPGNASGVIEFVSDDPVEPVRRGFVTVNQPGLGVGQKLPEMTVNLVDGGQWSSRDSEGEVMLLAYFATF
jgi:hypothetical protein